MSRNRSNLGHIRSLPAPSRMEASTPAEPRKAPAPPKALSSKGRAAWRTVMAHAPVLLPDLDAVTVERFCRLVDEREATAAELARGVLLSEPIISPTGRVEGERFVANPAAAMLRALDKELDALADRLAIVPAARAKLGLTLTAAERHALEIRAVLDGRFRKEVV